MRLLAVLALAFGGLAGLVACSQSESVVVQNNTTNTVVVYEDDRPTTLIGPGISRTFDIGDFRGTLTYEIRYFCDAKACDQTVLTERTFTWEEVQQAGGIKLNVEASVLGER
jgi:hypothetical protein